LCVVLSKSKFEAPNAEAPSAERRTPIYLLIPRSSAARRRIQTFRYRTGLL